jgi:hypothetical protein
MQQPGALAVSAGEPCSWAPSRDRDGRCGTGSSRQHAAAFGISSSSGTSGGGAGRSTIRSRKEGAMSSAQQLLDAAGRRRSPATIPGHHGGRSPCDKGMRYPADPPTVDEIVAVMRQAGEGWHGRRLRALIVVLWRAGFVSKRRSRSPRPNSTRAAGRFSSGMGRTTSGARSEWTRGRGRRWPVDRRPDRPAGRAALLRDRRTHPRPGMVSQRSQSRAAQGRTRRWRAPTVRPAPICRPDR